MLKRMYRGTAKIKNVLSCRPVSPNVFRAYSGQEETLVNEEPNKAGPGLVPPVYGLSVRPALLGARVCVCYVWKNRKGQGVVSTTASRSGSAASLPYGQEAPYASSVEEINGGLR